LKAKLDKERAAQITCQVEIDVLTRAVKDLKISADRFTAQIPTLKGKVKHLENKVVNEDMPSIHSSSNETPLDIAGPITTSRAKQLQKEIHSQVNANLMFNNQSMLNEPMLLSSCFNVLKNDGVYEPAWDQDGFKPLDI
jgi:hypothetical protein